MTLSKEQRIAARQKIVDRKRRREDKVAFWKAFNEGNYRKAEPVISVPYVYKPTAGYIYILHCTGFPYYKIGHTTQNPQSRLDACQTGVPFELVIEYAVQVKNVHDAEYKIHQQYKDKRVRGEWFVLTDQELETIKADIVALKDYIYGSVCSV